MKQAVETRLRQMEAVAPVRKGGRGLKPISHLRSRSSLTVAPVRKGGRGLKLEPRAISFRDCSSARPKGRARIETNWTRSKLRQERVAPVRKGGRGLKPFKRALFSMGHMVAPVRKGGRGLKLVDSVGQFRLGSCSARPKGRARIETTRHQLTPRRCHVAPVRKGGRGLKHFLT